MSDLVTLIIGLAVTFGFFYICYRIIKGFFSLFSRKPKQPHTANFTITTSFDDNDYDDKQLDDTAIKKEIETSWVPIGNSIKVKGYDIPDGMIYLGENLPSGNKWKIEPALINPKLKIKKSTAVEDGEDMNYWPSYSTIPDHCRGAYLHWLSTGRNNPNAYIGYVFLYIYGLERRVFYDTTIKPEAADDLLAIQHEVKRLYNIYKSQNKSFSRYVGEFLNILDLMTDGVDPEELPNISETLNDFPIRLSASLGARVKKGLAIDVDWAYAWALSDRDISLRTPAKRCPQEFKQLFYTLYKKKYPEGFKLKPNKTVLKYEYNPASNGLPGVDKPIMYEGESLPDVTVLKRPVTLINNILEDCYAQLEPYSRFLGRAPDRKNSLLGLGLLPATLLENSNHLKLIELKKSLRSMISDKELCEINSDVLFHFWPTSNSEKMSKKETTSFAQLLANLGYGIEPDPRFNKSPIKPDITTILFKLPDTAPTAPSQEYIAACNLIHLASLVASADGTISPDEEEKLESKLEKQMGLFPEERVRLHAHLRFTLANPVSIAGLKKRVEHISHSEKTAITRFLIDVALADGHVDANEVKVLEKIYKSLNMNVDELYGHIHTSTTKVIPLNTAKTEVPDVKSKPKLNEALLVQRMKETEEVSNILSSLLDNEQEETKDKHPPAVNDLIAGFDMGHSSFLQALGEREVWTRQDLESIADKSNLMLDGALEWINETAFDQCDAPVIDEEDVDVYRLDLPIYKEMLLEQNP